MAGIIRKYSATGKAFTPRSRTSAPAQHSATRPKDVNHPLSMKQGIIANFARTSYAHSATALWAWALACTPLLLGNLRVQSHCCRPDADELVLFSKTPDRVTPASHDQTPSAGRSLARPSYIDRGHRPWAFARQAAPRPPAARQPARYTRPHRRARSRQDEPGQLPLRPAHPDGRPARPDASQRSSCATLVRAVMALPWRISARSADSKR